MLQDFDLNKITEPLLEWFSSHARILPWREQVTPYRVWVSEIMLQQTRVEAVKPYFERFMTALPTIKDLAECEEEPLLKLWEGLGYYNRVRNLQIAAQTVMAEYGGELPPDYDKLLGLKGIGHYTAGAIASIAYGIPMPAVDGNVLRVIMRVSADDSDIMKQSVKTMVERALEEIMPKDQAGAFNQALMELGATVCVPNGEPQCHACPWAAFCETHKHNLWQQLPVKAKAKARRIEERTVLIIRDGDKIVLHKRPKKGLLAGLYEFPNPEGYLSEQQALKFVQNLNLHPMRIQKLEDAKHIFSHVEWHMKGYMIQVDSLTSSESDLLFVEVDESEKKYPIPAAFGAYTKYMNIRLGNERYAE
jgi:A/G-specific adenine glycosylase